MNKPIVKVKFVDFYPGHIPENDKCYKALSENFTVELSDKPDFVFASVFGKEVLDYDCVRIASIGENATPDFNIFDYAIAFDYLEYGDRFLRAPIFAFYQEFERLFDQTRIEKTDEQLLNRGFCSFVVSNDFGDPLRKEFYRELSKYKRVDSGGRFMNNVGGPVVDKNDFCSRYKFNIAFENSAFPGYTTEKVMQPLTVSSVPIYYGDPLIERDFSSECMVRVKSREDMVRAIEEIVYLDTHDEAYLKKCRAPTFVRGERYYRDALADFLLKIAIQGPKAAVRTARHGNQAVYRTQMQNYGKLDRALKNTLFRRFCHLTRLFK